MEAQFGLRREQHAKRVEEKPYQEQQVKKAEEKPYQEQKEKSCKMKEMGISPKLTFQLLNCLLNRHLKLEPQKNNDIDITEVTVNASIATTDSRTIKM